MICKRKLFFFEFGLMYCDFWSQYIKVRKLFAEIRYVKVIDIPKCYINRYNLIHCWHIKRKIMCFEKRSLIKKQLPLCCTRQKFKFVERFGESIKNLSNMPKSETFVYFTKITAETWSIKKITHVSIALLIMCKFTFTIFL